MLNTLRQDLARMRADRAGERFKNGHHRAGRRGFRKGWIRILCFIAALVSAAIGVVLVFIPGPAFVFFILSGALIATQWWPAAKALDQAELLARPYWARVKRQFGRLKRRFSPGKHST